MGLNFLVQMIVEEFSEKDAEELEKVFKRVWPYALEYPPAWREKRQLRKGEIVKEMRTGYHFFGSKNEKGEVIGVYKLLITEEGCFGEHQSILPEYAGIGVASAMYEQFIEYARMHGCRKNYVNILVTHEACIRLVEKYRFSKVGEVFEQAKGMKVQRYERLCHESG